MIIVVEEGEDQGGTYNQGAMEHSGSDISQTNTDQKSIQNNTKSGSSESNALPLSPASKRHLSEIMRHRYAIYSFSFSLLLLSYYDSDDDNDDDGDDGYTNTFSASCSFYSYTLHSPSPSPSFLISLYIVIIIFFYSSRSHINKDMELPSLFTVLSFDEFLLDFRKLRNAVHSGPVSSYSYKHLELLSAKYSLHTLLNSTRELDAQKSVCHFLPINDDDDDDGDDDDEYTNLCSSSSLFPALSIHTFLTFHLYLHLPASFLPSFTIPLLYSSTMVLGSTSRFLQYPESGYACPSQCIYVSEAFIEIHQT